MVMVKIKLPVIKTLDIIPVFFVCLFFGLTRDSLRWSSTLIHDNVYLSSLVRNLRRIRLKDWWQIGWEELTDFAKKVCLSSPVFSSGESHGQRILVGYSPWGHKELDMTEQLTASLSYASLMCVSRQLRRISLITWARCPATELAA